MVVAGCRRSGTGALAAAPFLVRRAASTRQFSTRRLGLDNRIQLGAVGPQTTRPLVSFQQIPQPKWTFARWQSSLVKLRLNLPPDIRRLSFDEDPNHDSEPSDALTDQQHNDFNESRHIIASKKHRFPNGRKWHNRQGRAFNETQQALKTDSLGKPTKVIILKEGESNNADVESSDYGIQERKNLDGSEQVEDSSTVLITDAPNFGSDVNSSIHGLRPKQLEGKLGSVLEKAEYEKLEETLGRSFTADQLRSYLQWFKSTQARLEKPTKYSDSPNAMSKHVAESIVGVNAIEETSLSTPQSNLPSKWRWVWQKERKTGKDQILKILLRNVWKVSTSEDHLALWNAKRPLKGFGYKILCQGEPSIMQSVAQQYQISHFFEDSLLFLRGRKAQVEHAAHILDKYIDSIISVKIASFAQDDKIQAWKQEAIYQHTRTIPWSSTTKGMKTTKHFLSGLKPHVEDAKKLLFYNRQSRPWLRETTIAYSQGKDIKSKLKLIPFSFQSSKIPLYLRLASSKYLRFHLPVDKTAASRTVLKSESAEEPYKPDTQYLGLKRKGRRLKLFLQELVRKKPLAFKGVGVWQANVKNDFTATLGKVLLENVDIKEQVNLEHMLQEKSVFLHGGVSFQVPGKTEEFRQLERETVRFLFMPHPEELYKHRMPQLILDFAEAPISSVSSSTDAQITPKLINIIARYPKYITDIAIPGSVADVRICSRQFVSADLSKLEEDSSGLRNLVSQITENINTPNIGGRLSPLITLPASFPRVLTKKKALQKSKDSELSEQEIEKLEKPVRFVLTGLERRKVIPFTNEETGKEVQYEHVSVDGGELMGRWSGYRVRFPVENAGKSEKASLKWESQEMIGFMKGVELLLKKANHAREVRDSYIRCEDD